MYALREVDLFPGLVKQWTGERLQTRAVLYSRKLGAIPRTCLSSKPGQVNLQVVVNHQVESSFS